MNFTESFNDFSSKLGTLDLALYAGVGIVLWVLFKDQLSPVQKMLKDLFNGMKSKLNNKENVDSVAKTIADDNNYTGEKDLFFKLVVSWKQTRDLAVQSGCSKAVEVADSMFPYLSPTVCSEKENKDAE